MITEEKLLQEIEILKRENLALKASHGRTY